MRINIFLAGLVSAANFVIAADSEAKLFVNLPIDFAPDNAKVSTDKRFVFFGDQNRYTIRETESLKIIAQGATAAEETAGGSKIQLSDTLEQMVFLVPGKAEVRVINPFTSKIIGSIIEKRYLTYSTISPDGSLVVAGGVSDGYCVFEASQTGGYARTKCVDYNGVHHPHFAAISPDKQLLVLSESQEQGDIKIFRLSDNQLVYSKKPGFLLRGGHKTFIDFFHFSADSRFLVSADMSGKTYVHDLTKGEAESVSTSNNSILNAEIDAAGKVKLCEATVFHPLFKQIVKFSVCLPGKTQGPVHLTGATLDKSSDLRSLIPTLIPDYFPATQTELGDQKMASGSIIRAKWNANLAQLVTVEGRSGGVGEFAVYQPNENQFKEINSFRLNRVWNTYGSKDRSSTADFAVTDAGNLFIKMGSEPFLLYNLYGGEIHECKAPGVYFFDLDIVEYSSTKKLLAGAEHGQLAIWSEDCLSLVEGHDETGQIADLKFTQSGNLIVTKSNHGIFQFRKTSDLTPVATLIRQSNDSWAVAAADGRYDGQGEALTMLHYAVNNEIVSLADFDKSFFTPGLLQDVLSEKPSPVKPNTPAVPKMQIAKTLVGKIHSIQGAEIMLAGNKLNLGEKVFAIVGGKKVFLKVTFTMHTGAKSKMSNASEANLLTKGMPVFR